MAIPETPNRTKISQSLLKLPSSKPPTVASATAEIAKILGLPAWTPGSSLPTPQQRLGRTAISPSTVRQDWARERAYKNSLTGWQRTMGSFSEGPVMKALMGLTKPLSMTAGAVKETLDWAGGGEWNKADWHKAVDETYFFGDVLRDFDILQGDAWWEKWGARTLGFAGDVALDPLTYLGLVGKGIGIAARLAGGGGRAIAGQAIRQSVIRGLGDDGIRVVKNMGLADGLTDDILGAAVDDIVSGTSNVVTRLADGSIAFGVGKQSGRTGFVTAADGATMAIDDVARITLEPTVVSDIKKIMNAEMRAGKRGASAVTTEELRLVGKHMFESGIDKAGRAGADVFRAADKKWAGGVLKSMKEADKLDLQFGLKIPGTGPLGRMMFRHQLQRPVGIRMLNSRIPGVGTFVRGVPQGSRFVFMGLKHGESGLFGWMKRGGRLPELRKLMRTEWLNDPAKRHAGRAMLHAAGRGDAMARTVKQEMIRHANQFFKDVADSGANTKDVYHALAGDEAAAARIGQELTGKGIKFMATLREVANRRAGHEFLGESSNYVPRVLSDEARDYLDNKGIGLVTRKHRRPYEASGFEKQRKYVPKSEFDAAVEAEYKQLLKKNAKATMGQAQKKVQGRGLEPDFLGEELVTPGTILNDGTVAKDVEQQIADIMDRTGISYALFDDDLLASIPAYIEAVSARTGEVFTETLLKNKGVFRERMVELTRFPNAKVSAATKAVRKSQRLLMDATGELQVLFKKRAEAEAPSSLLDQRIAAQEEILAAAERHFTFLKDRLDAVADGAVAEEVRLVAAKADLDEIIAKINELQLQKIGITEEELVKRGIENQVLLNAAADLLDEGGVLHWEWKTASASTAALVHLEDRILSAFGSSEVFDAFEVLSKHLAATNSDWATQQTGVDWLETLVGVELLPDEGHGFIRATIIEPRADSALAAGFSDQPAVFLVETTDGEIGFHAWDVGEKLSDARKIVQDLDENGVGAWLGLEMTLTDDVLFDDSVAQLAWSRRHLAEIAGDAADNIERYIEVSGLPTSVGGIGAIPTPEAVMAARKVITETIADVTSEAGIDATFHADNGSFRDWLMTSNPEFQEAVWTYFSTMPGMTTPRYPTMGALTDDVDQMTQQILDIVRKNEAFIRQADSIRFTVTNEQGEVIRHYGLAEYVNALRFEVGVETAKHTGTPMTVHTTNVEDIMNADYHLIAAGGGNAGKAPGLPDGSQQSGQNWQTALYMGSKDRPSAPSGGSNPGYLVKVPDNAGDITGSGKYYYVKSYSNDTGLPDSASVDVGGGMMLSAGESGKHRVQGEALANALYRSFGVERGVTRMGVELLGTAPTTGAAPVRGSAFGTMSEGTWTVTSGYEKLLRPAVHGIPIADQVRVQFKSGLYDIAQVVNNGYRLRTGEVLTQADLAAEPVLLSELAGDQFLVDVLVSNLDTFGLNGDNIAVKSADGMIYRIDNGGVFHWGAMGGMKRKYQINDIAYAWDEVIEFLGGPGTHQGKGTFLGGLPPGMSSNVANAPAKNVKVGQYMAPAWMQFRDAVDAVPGAGFTGEMEQQLKALMKVRARHGGWHGFVFETLGPHASNSDIEMFARFLEVRTEKLANHFGLEFPEAGSTAMVVQAAEDFGIDQAATHAVMESLPFEPIMATAEASGYRAWVNRAPEQLHGIYYKPEADASGVLSYPSGTEISPFDPRSQWAERMTLKEALKRTNRGKHLPQSPTHVLKALDGMGDTLPLLVAEGKPLSAYSLDERLLFDDTAAEMLEDVAAEQQAIVDNVVDDLAEQQVGVSELDDDWGFGYDTADPDFQAAIDEEAAQKSLVDATQFDDDVQRKLDEAFGTVDEQAGDDADIWLAEQKATDIQDLQADLSFKINQALQRASHPTDGPPLSISDNLITSMDAVPWTAAHRSSGRVGVVVLDDEGKIVMRMPITDGKSAVPMGGEASQTYWAHTAVDLDFYPGSDLRHAAVLAAEDSLGMNVELVGFVPVVKGDDTPYFIARRRVGSTTIAEDGPAGITQSPVASETILRLFTESRWGGEPLDPMYFLGRQQGSWMDTSMGGINATVPPLVAGGGNGVHEGTVKTFAMGIRIPQGAARNIKIFGAPPAHHKEWATSVARLAAMGPWEQQNDAAMKKIAERLREMSPTVTGSGNYANKDMALDMFESIHDSNPELWAQLKAFLGDDFDRENLWKDVGDAGKRTQRRGQIAVALFDAVDTAGRRGIDVYDDLSWRQRLVFFGYLQRSDARVIPSRNALEAFEGEKRLHAMMKGIKGVGRLSDEEFERHVVNYIATISDSNAITSAFAADGFTSRVNWETAHILEPLTGNRNITATFAEQAGSMSAKVQPQVGGKGASLMKAGFTVPLSGPALKGADVAHGGRFLTTTQAGPGALRHQRALRLWANLVEGWRIKMAADGHTVAVWGNREGAQFKPPAGSTAAGPFPGSHAEQASAISTNFMITNPRAVQVDQTPIIGAGQTVPGVPPWKVHELWGIAPSQPHLQNLRTSSVMEWQQFIDQYQNELGAALIGDAAKDAGDPEDLLQALNRKQALAVESMEQVEHDLTGALLAIEEAELGLIPARTALDAESEALDEFIALRQTAQDLSDTHRAANDALTRLGAGMDAAGNEIPLEALSDDLRNLRIAVGILGEGDAEMLRMAKEALEEGEDALTALGTFSPVGDDDTFYPLTRLQDRELILESVWASGFQPFGSYTQGPADMVEAMTAVTRFRAHGGWGRFLREYDKIHNLMKGYMIMKPGFHMRNFFSAVFMNYLHGVNLSSYRQFQRAYWRFQYDEALVAGLERRAARMKKVMVSRGIWGKATPEHMDILREMRDGGILGGTQGQVAGEFLAAPQVAGKKINFGLINPMNPRNAPLRISREVGVGTETFVRGVMGFDTLKKGGTVDEAFDTVVKFHFDYDDLSDFERKVVKRIVPFYTWTRKNMPLMLEQIGRNPAKMTAYLKAKHEIEMDLKPPGIIPNYFKRQGAIQLPFKYEGQDMFILPDLPFKTPIELLDPMLAFDADTSVVERLRIAMGSLGTQITPLIKAPYEWKSKQNLWKGYTFDGRFQQVPTVFVKTPGLMRMLQPLGLAAKQNDIWIMRDYNLHTMAQLMPTFSDMRRLFPSEERYQQRTLSTWMSFAFGLGLRTNTVEEQQRTLRSEFYKQLDEMQDMRSMMGAVERTQ